MHFIYYVLSKAFKQQQSFNDTSNFFNFEKCVNEAFKHLEADSFSLSLPDIVKETVAETLGAIIRASALTQQT